MIKLGAFLGGLIMGGIAGAAAGILTAPKSGIDTREDIAEKSEDFYRKAAYELEELAEKVDKLKTKINVGDYAPVRVVKAEEAIAKAQSAMNKAESTSAESQKLLDKTGS